MRPHSEVTLHLTREQYEHLLKIVYAAGAADPLLVQILLKAEFDPLLDERVTVGSSFKKGTG